VLRRAEIGRVVPLPSRLEGLGHIVSSRTPCGVLGRAPTKKRVLVYFELELTHMVTRNCTLGTFVTHKRCLNLRKGIIVMHKTFEGSV